MKINRSQFMQLARNRSIPLEGLQNSPDFDPERVRHLVPADLNQDGVIRGREELNQLRRQLSHLSGSTNTSEINVSQQPADLLGLLRDVAGREGVRRSVGPTETGETATAETRTDTPRTRGPSQVQQPDRRASLISQITRAGGSSTEEDVAAVAERLQRVPISALERLASRGATVVSSRGSVTDHLPHLSGVRPRGYPPGRTWDNVQGAYNSETREAVIGTTSQGGRRVVAPSASADVVLHETGHAYDHAQGRPSTNDAAFVAAREQDLDAITQSRMGPYLTQEGDAGRSETYAETFAMFLADPGRLERTFPNLYQYWTQQFPGQN